MSNLKKKKVFSQSQVCIFHRTIVLSQFCPYKHTLKQQDTYNSKNHSLTLYRGRADNPAFLLFFGLGCFAFLGFLCLLGL